MASFGPAPPLAPGPFKPFQSAITDSMSSHKYINAVYYPNYRVYRGDTPASMNYDCITHVFYSFAHVTSDGIVFLSDEHADMKKEVDGVQSGCLGSFMRIKERNEHLKLILSIGGGTLEQTQNFAAVAASAVNRDTFGRSARSWLDAWPDFDGIDIDWEHPADDEEGRNFLSLLAAIRIHLPDDRYLLTAALPAGAWVLRHIDLNRAQDYLDLINLMAYDFVYQDLTNSTTRAGHHAQLYPGAPGEPCGSAGVDYAIGTGFPGAKILFGIPAYGRSFLGAPGPGYHFTGYGGDAGTFEYKSLPRSGTEEIVNTTVVAAFCTGGDGGFVSYDNPTTVKIKAAYCKEKRLAGIFYWTGTADVASGERSLIVSSATALLEA